MPTSTPTSLTAPSYSQTDWQKGYRSLHNEFDYWIDNIDGQIPPQLRGTLFRNGPGLLDVNGQRLHHPFDGDGMVCAIAFDQGRAHFRNRYVQTAGYLAEQQAGRILYRGVFGTQKPGGWLANAFDFRVKNIANTNIIYWGGKLLALWEAAQPHRLDPATLATLGLEDLDGVLAGGKAFGAHPWIDPACEFANGEPRLVNFSITPGLSTTITVYELNPQGQVVQQHAHNVPGFAFIHDFAITPNYCIFFQNPVTFNPVPFALGLKSAGYCIGFQADQPTQMILIPRHGNAPMQVIPAKAGFVFHHANAFEQDGRLYVDSVCYNGFPSVEPDADYLEVDFAATPYGQLWRFTIDRQQETVTSVRLEERCCEFPTVHPDRVGRPYRYLYLGATHAATGNAPLQAILKLDLTTGDRQIWSAAPRGFVSEPVFVPCPGCTDEDAGWLLTLVFNGERERSELVILDAQDLTRGAIATLYLKHHVPYGLHGNFTPEVF
ncbi:MAG: carotenoid oxygenase family protein [Synechococcales bacterium]|nr:carotenoid oxygenase family protein [Synechococcales bacterium]